MRLCGPRGAMVLCPETVACNPVRRPRGHRCAGSASSKQVAAVRPRSQQPPGLDPEPWLWACQGSEAALRQQLQAAEDEAAGLRAGLAAAASAVASGGRPGEPALPPRALAVLDGAEQALRDAQVGARAPRLPLGSKGFLGLGGPACACCRAFNACGGREPRSAARSARRSPRAGRRAAFGVQGSARAVGLRGGARGEPRHASAFTNVVEA